MEHAVEPIVDDLAGRHDHRFRLGREPREVVRLELVIDAAIRRHEHLDPLRIERRLYDALERWASDDLRSVNAQIEFLLRESLRRAGRLPAPSSGEDGPGE